MTDITDLALAAFGRCPASYELDQYGVPILVDFVPPLTTEEQATLALLVAVARSPVALTTGEYSAIRSHVQALRDFRQLGRNAFMALTAAERDRQLYDAQTATTIVLLALLRE
jgi:hypothetical protein